MVPVPVVVPVAQLLGVSFDLETGEIFAPVAVAVFELAGLLLSVQDGQAVVATWGALAAVEHGPAQSVVVVQRCRTEGVGGADPFGHGTRHHSVVRRRVADLWSAHFYAILAESAELVVPAVAGGQGHPKLGAREGYEGPLTGVGASGGTPRKNIGAIHHVAVEGLVAAGPVGALCSGKFAVLGSG